ncbi:nickel pincer cofactor biosynthesis protein LarB [Thermoanaerobacterium sp. DL9XJH110]|uniref:nickel pincer cofactor biosynthesis protein LarB n=1 Tax=Thermoanaerobacterium sp. DL9XJH110 TaxID=3386643 RepID=UPI003BB7F7FA
MEKLKEILQNIKLGKLDVEEAMAQLKNLPYEDLGFARIDHHRSLRRGVPEVIFCEGKTSSQVVEITRRMLKSGTNVLGTRADRKTFREVQQIAPDAKYHEDARIFVIERERVPLNKGIIAVVTAGTSDIPVAEEAAVTAEVLGNRVERLYDVGVAGIHRLLMNMEVLRKAQVIIVAAGMEGALASVVAGLVDKPVVAVPTSVGYGANFHGLSALLTMLNSCAGGISVVNIDNGFGAGFVAHQINRLGGTEEQ